MIYCRTYIFTYHLWSNTVGSFGICIQYFAHPKKVLKSLCGTRYCKPCQPLFISTKILTIINLHIFHSLLFTKDNHLFFTRQHSLSKTSSLHQVNCIRLFNKLQASAHTITLNKLKTKLTKQTIHFTQ